MQFSKFTTIFVVLHLCVLYSTANECRRKNYVGFNCTASNECLEKFNSYCDETTNQCECNEGWISLDSYLCYWKSTCNQTCLNNQFCNTDKGTCEDKKELLGDSCNAYGQCSPANSFCDYLGKCNCIVPYKPNANNTACVLCDAPQKCNSTSECNNGYFCDGVLSICRENSTLTLGEVCTSDDQCYSDTSFCCLDTNVDSGHCKCKSGYDSTDGSTCVASSSPKSKAAICNTYKADLCNDLCTDEQYCEYNGWYYYCEQKPYVGDKCPGFVCFSENASCDDASVCTCNDFYELSVNNTCEYKPTSCSSGCPMDTHYCDDAKGLCRKQRYLGGICSETSQCIVEKSKCDILSHNNKNCDLVGRCMCDTYSSGFAACYQSPDCSTDAECIPSFGDTYYCDKTN